MYRLWILISFGYVYTDSDQSIMWLGASDYYKGLYYEPCFYGQSYNTMLESFLAVPLYALGCPLHIALPSITVLISVFPFIFLSLLAFNRRSKASGIIILLIPFLLPIQYDFLTSISRGFVTGIFIVSLSFFSLFKPESIYSFTLCGLFSTLGFIANPNSVLISIPCVFYLFVFNYKSMKFYVSIILSSLPGIFLFVLIKLFYINNPNFIIHKYDLSFSATYFLDGIKNLDRLFNYVTPIFWKQGWMTTLFPLAFCIYFFRIKKNQEALTSLVVLIIIPLTLFTSKVLDGSESIFFSFSRMYLALPVIIGVLVSFINIRRTKLLYLLLLLSFASLTYKITVTKKQTLNCINNTHHVVGIASVNDILNKCKELDYLSRKLNIELIIVSNHWMYDFITYGCPACIDGFPATLRPSYERRTWRLLEDENRVYKNIIIIDTEIAPEYDNENIRKIDDENGIFLIQDNQIATMLLLKQLKITVWDF